MASSERYRVFLQASVLRSLRSMPREIALRVDALLLLLAREPRPHGVKRLQHREGYRVRVSDYRVLYTVDDTKKTVGVYVIGHRKEVYRR